MGQGGYSLHTYTRHKINLPQVYPKLFHIEKTCKSSRIIRSYYTNPRLLYISLQTPVK